MRRHKENPRAFLKVALIGGGVAALGVAGFFLVRKHEEKALGEAASSNAGAAPLATVATNDPPPLGDLIIRSGPSSSAPQIGGAEKGGLVSVLDGNASQDFAKVAWDGGARLPAVTGFAHKSALSPV